MSEASNRTQRTSTATSTAAHRRRLIRRREDRKVTRMRYVRDMTLRHYIRRLLSEMDIRVSGVGQVGGRVVRGSISGDALDVLASMIRDMFDDLASACQLFLTKNLQRTLTHREVQSAVVVVLPGDLRGHALSEAEKALQMYAEQS